MDIVNFLQPFVIYINPSKFRLRNYIYQVLQGAVLIVHSFYYYLYYTPNFLARYL